MIIKIKAVVKFSAFKKKKSSSNGSEKTKIEDSKKKTKRITELKNTINMISIIGSLVHKCAKVRIEKGDKKMELKISISNIKYDEIKKIIAKKTSDHVAEVASCLLTDENIEKLITDEWVLGMAKKYAGAYVDINGVEVIRDNHSK